MVASGKAYLLWPYFCMLKLTLIMFLCRSNSNHAMIRSAGRSLEDYVIPSQPANSLQAGRDRRDVFETLQTAHSRQPDFSSRSSSLSSQASVHLVTCGQQHHAVPSTGQEAARAAQAASYLAKEGAPWQEVGSSMRKQGSSRSSSLSSQPSLQHHGQLETTVHGFGQQVAHAAQEPAQLTVPSPGQRAPYAAQASAPPVQEEEPWQQVRSFRHKPATQQAASRAKGRNVSQQMSPEHAAIGQPSLRPREHSWVAAATQAGQPLPEPTAAATHAESAWLAAAAAQHAATHCIIQQQQTHAAEQTPEWLRVSTGAQPEQRLQNETSDKMQPPLSDMPSLRVQHEPSQDPSDSMSLSSLAMQQLLFPDESTFTLSQKLVCILIQACA